MINTQDILETINMIREECLDIRTITMGISLLDCTDPDIKTCARKIYDKITRKAEDRFEIVFSYVPINIAMGSKRELFTYLNTWGNSKRAYFSALFTIATNNGAFRAGESDHLQFIITGEGELWDKDSSYTVAFEISEPLRVNFNDNGLIASNKASVGAMCITNSLGEWADVTMALYNTIVIDYHPKDGAPIRGYYDWNGTCITPR